MKAPHKPDKLCSPAITEGELLVKEYCYVQIYTAGTTSI